MLRHCDGTADVGKDVASSSGDSKATKIAELWKTVAQSVQEDVEETITIIQAELGAARSEVRGVRRSILSLAEIVKADKEHSLLRYLRGAGLLGADHLQYPENLVLAALDITRQNVLDNVWYSELRCATVGYGHGGMSWEGATELLCRSFDLAASVWAQVFDGRWVRMNVLLGAKRHKPAEIPDTVSLLRHFLNRHQEDRDHSIFEGPPEWWGPCKVVGFDLSGSESRENARLTTQDILKSVDPLLVSCAPITIHAGEAASAQNIWDAVYRLGARRIGHGLRLREDAYLLGHVKIQGTCLELCPISNELTNEFDKPSETDGDNRLRRRYPLSQFMEEEMQICINTDNRFLHEKCELTDEYLKAAELCGGLSRYQVLRLVRAGFSNAFLPPRERKAMLDAVEERVFKILNQLDGERHGLNGR